MNIIDRLKANEKPFGLMDEDLQEAAVEIGVGEFDFFLGNHDGGWSGNEQDTMFRYYRTYRLEDDYKQESEVVECGIYPGSHGKLWFNLFY